jgi:hypothetical protein
MMKRAKGTTLAEITEATAWQNHTVRGFVSILGSKNGEKIESTKNAARERSYRSQSGEPAMSSAPTPRPFPVPARSDVVASCRQRHRVLRDFRGHATLTAFSIIANPTFSIISPGRVEPTRP